MIKYFLLQLASDGADVDALINDSCDLDMRDLLKRMSYPKERRLTAREALNIVESKQNLVSIVFNPFLPGNS